MNLVEPLGYLASALVLATFCMRDIVTLRWMAIASNLAFMAYGALADVGPVLALHLMLLPVNMVRLAESLRGGATPKTEATSPATPCPPPRRP